jgi:type IV secretory pathway VirB4 component
MRLRRPPHQATTAQLGSVFPLAASARLPVDGVLIGRDRFGDRFVHDPFELYRVGAITNPNICVLGQIGRGKSALVKTYLYRQAAFGRRIVVLDPKGEYGPLARALGVAPIRLEPGGLVRLNPLALDERADLIGEERRRRVLGLATAVAASAASRPLRPAEHAAIEVALSTTIRRSDAPVLGTVVDALLDPESGAGSAVGLDDRALAIEGRDVALELRRLVSGELAGMFDGPSTPGVDLSGRIVVLDLSALYQSTALPTLLTCAAAALESTWRDESRGPTILVLDEAWAVLHNVGAARFFQSSFKLARAHGVANLAVLHRISDLAAVGDAGTATVQIAEGLLSDCETVVCYAQAPGEVADAVRVLHLDEAEAAMLPRLGRGVALWRVGGRRFLVEHELGASERGFIDTDGRLSAVVVGRHTPATARDERLDAGQESSRVMRV